MKPSLVFPEELQIEHELPKESRVERPPVILPPPRRPMRLVRWLEWLVIGALIVGAAAASYFLLRGGDEAQIRADLLGTRYREAGMVVASGMLPEAAEMAHLEAMTDVYLARVTPTAAPVADAADVAHLSALNDLYLARIDAEFAARQAAIAADGARLTAMAKAYMAPVEAELAARQVAISADAARWTAMAEAHLANSSPLTAGQLADAARWAALAEALLS